MNEAEYKRLAEFETEYWWFVARRRLIRTLIGKYGPTLSTAKYLDVGCGTGIGLREIGRGAVSSVGMDLSPAALSLTRRRVESPLVAADAGMLPFAADSFDLVTCLDVLEHVRNDLECIKECHRILRPGGCLVVSVPALDFLWSEHDEAIYHLRRYSRPGLKAKLLEAGFRIEKITYAVCALCLPIFVVRVVAAFRRKRIQPQTMLTKMMPWANRLLIALHDVENMVARPVSLPFGTGLVCIARK